MAQHTFSIKQALLTGWHKTIENWWFIAKVMLVFLGVNLLQWGLQQTTPTPDELQQQVMEQGQISFAPLLIQMLVNLVLSVVLVVFSIGVTRIALAIMRNEELNIAELVRHYRLFFRFVGGQILAGIIITFGIFLLIIPGILLSLRYMFVPYLIVDRHAGPITAIKQSWRLTAGYTWRLFLLWLAFVGISIIPATLAGILLASQSVFGVSESAALAVSLAGGAVLIVVAVLLAPVVLLTTAHVYNFLLGREEASAADLSTEKPSSADESQPADQHARASAEDSPSPDQS